MTDKSKDELRAERYAGEEVVENSANPSEVAKYAYLAGILSERNRILDELDDCDTHRITETIQDESFEVVSMYLLRAIVRGEI